MRREDGAPRARSLGRAIVTHDVVVVLAPLFLFAHFLFDFPLQGDFLSRAKNPLSPLPGVSWRWAPRLRRLLHKQLVHRKTL